MAYFIGAETDTKNMFTYQYSGISEQDLSSIVNNVFIQNGYKAQSDAQGNIVYIRGSRTMRLLFGAFCKYFKFTTRVNANGGLIYLSIVNETSGMSGGLIGMNQVTNEMTKIKNILRGI